MLEGSNMPETYEISTEIYRKIAEEFNCSVKEISVERKFVGGKSGDDVYLITVSTPANLNRIGQYILKIKSNSSADEFDNEVSNTQSAKSKCSSSKIIIPAVECSSVSLGYYVYNVAGTGAKETSTLFEQIPPKKLSRLNDLVNASLFAWKKNYSATTASISQIAQSWLGEKRLLPDSRLVKRLHSYIHDEFSEAWKTNDQIFPNPYYYFTCASSEEKNPTLKNVLQGPQHGDFNQTNILIQP